jgi:hypothetical protein
MEWIGKVLTSEFVWGIIIGLLLSLSGAWWQARLTSKQQKEAQRDLIKNFCIDTVNNIKAIVDDMVDHRQRTQGIHGDYLALLDIELNVFGRNREQLTHLPNPVRENVRKFVTDCAIRRGEIGTNIAQFSRLRTLADQMQSQGHGPEAQRMSTQANVPLASANQALNQLATKVSGSADLVNSLQQMR